MYLPFEQLPDSSKVWVYQSEKKLSESQINIISQHLKSFCEEWLVHGQPLETSFDIRYDVFIVLAANDAASGCSIDTSVRVMKGIGQKLGLDFFRRTDIAFLLGTEVVFIPLQEIRQQAGRGNISAQTSFFNNAVATKKELNNGWLVPAGASWLKKYFPSETLKQ